MEVNRNCFFLLLFSFLLLFFTLFGATQAHVRSLQSAHAINDSGQAFLLLKSFHVLVSLNLFKILILNLMLWLIVGKEINLATNFTQIDNDGHESMRRAILKSTENSKKKSVSKKGKKKKKRSAATTSRGNPSLALLSSTFLLGFAALSAC